MQEPEALQLLEGFEDLIKGISYRNFKTTIKNFRELTMITEDETWEFRVQIDNNDSFIAIEEFDDEKDDFRKIYHTTEDFNTRLRALI